MFSSGPQYPKLKTNLRLSINRLKLLGKKKTEMTQKSRKEIADYIAGHKEDRARIRVEHIIREDYIVEAYELLEMYCDLLLARFGLIQQMKELDDGLEEAINSVLWAAPRIVADVQEFKIIADQLAVKYGKPFAEACRVNQFGKVNPKLMHKLGVVAPPKILVEKYMIEIAKSCNVPFTPDENVMREDEVAAAEAMLIDFQNTGQQGGGWMYPQPPGQMPPQMMQQPPPAYPHVAPTQSMFEEAEAREANRHQQPPHQPPPHQAFNYPAPRQPNQQSIDEKSTYSDLPSPTDSYPDLSAQHQSNNEPEDISNLKMPRNETGAASAPDPGLSDSVMPPPPPAPAPSDSAPPGNIRTYSLYVVEPSISSRCDRKNNPSSNDNLTPGFVLPTLPDPPSDDFPKPPDSPPGHGGGDEGIDYDDLTRRFNNLKKHK